LITFQFIYIEQAISCLEVVNDDTSHNNIYIITGEDRFNTAKCEWGRDYD